MGTGGTSFRSVVGGACALSVLLSAACRSGGGVDELRSLLRVDSTPESRSLAAGHLFGRWLEVEPEGDARAALEKACLSEQVGDAEKAIHLLSDALSDSPCASLYEARGALYLTAGFPRAAAGDFQKAVALASGTARSWYALGHAYEVLGLDHQALEALEHAHSLGREDTGLFLALARVQRALGRVGLAARHYERALRSVDDPGLELLVEACALAIEDPARAGAVAALRDRLESCLRIQPSQDASLMRALLNELSDKPSESILAAFRTLEMSASDLVLLTRHNLVALQLLDPATRAEAREELLQSEPEEARRASLARCLPRE